MVTPYKLGAYEFVWEDDCGDCPAHIEFDSSDTAVCKRQFSVDGRCFRGDWAADNDWFGYHFELPPEWGRGDGNVDFTYEFKYWALGAWENKVNYGGSMYCTPTQHMAIESDCTDDFDKPRRSDNICDNWDLWTSPDGNFDAYAMFDAADNGGNQLACFQAKSHSHTGWTHSTLALGFWVWDDSVGGYGLTGAISNEAWAVSDFKITFTTPFASTTQPTTTTTKALTSTAPTHTTIKNQLTTTTMIPTTTTIPTTMPTSTESLTSTEMQTSTGTTEKPATERPSASSEMLTSTETRTSTGMPTTSSLPMPTTTSTTLLPTTSTRTLPTAVESTSGKPQSTRRSTELTTFSTKKPTATVLQTMTPTANRTTTNILPTVSSKRNTTVVIMATNTTESGIEESDDSSTGRRQVLSARMWLFFGGVFCLSTVGCTFIWTKYKRNQRIATELMLRKLAIRSESERILRHKGIVKRDVSNRLSRVSAAVASLPSSEIPAVAPFNDEVVASSTEMAVLSSNLDTPLPIPRSAEERSLSNDLELCRPMATAGVSEAAAETGAVGPFVWVKAGEMSAELTTTTTLSSQFYDELEGAVAGDGLGTVIYARAVAHTEDDEVKGDSEALSAAASISSNCAALSVLCPTESQMSEGPSSGLAALRLADIEDAQVDGDAKCKRKPDGSFNSDGGKVEIVCVPRSGLRRQRESNRGAALPGSGVSALVPPSLSPLMWSSERHSGGFAVLRHAIEDALADGGEVAVCRSRSGEVLRQPPSIAVPSLLPPIVAAMHSEARSGDCSRRQEECGKKESRKKRKAKGRRKKKRKKAAVDLSLLEASAEQRAKWTHSQWYHYYRAYDCSTPEAYRRSMASMSADVSPRTVASCELPRHFE